MGCSPSTEGTELERQQKEGDLTSAGIVKISHFFRLVVVLNTEWQHEDSGRIHAQKRYQPLKWNLTKLDLRDNKLKYFPSSVGNVRRLVEIDLSQNNIKRFPADAFNARRLQVLRLTENKIRNVRLPSPDRLNSLVELHLDNNRISELPGAFVDLRHLEVLNLSANEFTDFPEVLVALDSLKSLLLEQNQIWFLPNNFDNLTTLEVLSLNANNFSKMPRVLSHMTSLIDLRLGRNGILSLMEGEVIDTHLDDGRVITMKVETFKLMSNLRKLTVAMNELTELPPDMWDVRLDHLNLRNNQIAGRLPDDVEKLMHTLVELFLDENEITMLPGCLKDFTALTQLTVNANKLKQLPRLPPQLLELQAKDNDLGQLPKCLWEKESGQWETLELLDVRGNIRLAYQPPSFALKEEEVTEYLRKLGQPDVGVDMITGLRKVEETQEYIPTDSYGNPIIETAEQATARKGAARAQRRADAADGTADADGDASGSDDGAGVDRVAMWVQSGGTVAGSAVAEESESEGKVREYHSVDVDLNAVKVDKKLRYQDRKMSRAMQQSEYVGCDAQLAAAAFDTVGSGSDDELAAAKTAEEAHCPRPPGRLSALSVP